MPTCLWRPWATHSSFESVVTGTFCLRQKNKKVFPRYSRICEVQTIGFIVMSRFANALSRVHTGKLYVPHIYWRWCQFTRQGISLSLSWNFRFKLDFIFCFYFSCLFRRRGQRFRYIYPNAWFYIVFSHICYNFFYII